MDFFCDWVVPMFFTSVSIWIGINVAVLVLGYHLAKRRGRDD